MKEDRLRAQGVGEVLEAREGALGHVTEEAERGERITAAGAGVGARAEGAGHAEGGGVLAHQSEAGAGPSLSSAASRRRPVALTPTTQKRLSTHMQ